MTRSLSASPTPKLRIKIMLLKVAMVVFGSAMHAYPKLQAIGMLACAAWITWMDIINVSCCLWLDSRCSSRPGVLHRPRALSATAPAMHGMVDSAGSDVRSCRWTR